MIVGVGVDVVAVEVFARQLELTGTTFDHAFTGAERRTVRQRAAVSGDESVHLAARWAAKEALVKAWSAALVGRPPVMSGGMPDPALIETVADPWHRPSLVLHHPLSALVDSSLADAYGRGTARWHVSLSHDEGFAVATVIVDWLLVSTPQFGPSDAEIVHQDT